MNKINYYNSGGFTLIELLVVISVMLITIGTGVAAYLDFNERQILQESGRQLETNLLSARSQALAGTTPEGCQTLMGYQASGFAQSFEIELKPLCQVDEGVQANIYAWDPSVRLSEDFSTTFFPLHGGAEWALVVLNKGDQNYVIQVGQGGNIQGKLASAEELADLLTSPAPTGQSPTPLASPTPTRRPTPSPSPGAQASPTLSPSPSPTFIPGLPELPDLPDLPELPDDLAELIKQRLSGARRFFGNFGF